MMIIGYDHIVMPSIRHMCMMKYYNKYWKKNKWGKKRIDKYFYKYLN